MLKNIIHFLKYNNLTTLAVAAALVGSGSAFAASPELREAADDILVGRTEAIVSVDNAAILRADFDNFDPALTITAVSEDTNTYYVSYTFNTFAVLDGAWRSALKEGTLKVSKSALVSIALKNYISEELGEVARAEIAYLQEAREVEWKKGETRKQVAAAYIGLLGLIIDPQEKEPEPKSPEFSPPVAAAIESAPVNLEVQPPSVDIFPNVAPRVNNSQPIIDNLDIRLLIESATTTVEFATTTDSEISAAPIEPVSATTTAPIITPEILPTDIVSITPVI